MTTEIKYRYLPGEYHSDNEDALTRIYSLAYNATEGTLNAYEVERICEEAGVQRVPVCPECRLYSRDEDAETSILNRGHCGCED